MVTTISYDGNPYSIVLTGDIVDLDTPCDIKISGVMVHVMANFGDNELRYVEISGVVYKVQPQHSIIAGIILASIIIVCTIVGTIAAALAGAGGEVAAAICVSGILVGIIVFLCIAGPSLHKKIMDYRAGG
jgi:hypothetical protein